MARQTPLFFTFTFATVTLLEMLGDTLSIRWLHYVCKPLIMGLLLYYVWQQFRSATYTGPLRWLMVGMGFALLGDVFLMIQEVDLFALGLGAFLVMQICYSRAFWLEIQASGKTIRPRTFSLTAIPFVLYNGIFLFLLKPRFFLNPDLKPLWWPVVGYVFCLSLMGVLAFLRKGLLAYGWVAIGAVLFILSDSAIAIDKFLLPISGATWFIMTTYAIAQYLIVMGIVQHEWTVVQSD
ncbi:lysoplasmalogenase [Spirosoma sp. BT702]|uniref:Lysoplasmalogenase n=1 Tax=Spirosoma profusum TaxID=2771354 RepID=A0A927ATE2_9BACT|nr:lysoplasmalogenase [Spirosoma profusum]MBD2703290.1 lysoplasmalogenase [Spirosoma profusum]